MTLRIFRRDIVSINDCIRNRRAIEAATLAIVTPVITPVKATL